MRKRALAAAFWVAAFALGVAPALACPAATCLKVIDNGPDAGKKVVVVLGDGYRAGADQDLYNDQVYDMVVRRFFNTGFMGEENNAFNVYRVNLLSNEEGVGRVTFDAMGNPTFTPRDTALLYLFSGIWNRCWLQHSMDIAGNDLTERAKSAALAANGLSHADYVFVLLNEADFGGCNRGPRDIVQTSGAGWEVLAHEAGHGIGGLMDEYHNQAMPWSGGALTNRNCSTVLHRSNVLWNRYVAPATAVPTTFGTGMDESRTVGEFEGCSTFQTGIWRPVEDCRMKGNVNEFCPVCQNLMRNALYPAVRHDFRRAATGDFDGDGRDDVLVQNDDDWAVYLASGSPFHLDRAWTNNNSIPGRTGYPISWDMTIGDQIAVGDFDGDGKDDLYVLNVSSWSLKQLGMLRSTGLGFEQVKWQYTSIDFSWTIGIFDQILPGDFNGDGKDDLYVFSAGSWARPVLGLFRSTGTTLLKVQILPATVPGASTWTMSSGDRYQVADFNGDGKDDLYGYQESTGSIALLGSSGTALTSVAVHTGSLPGGWPISAGHRQVVADFDGDGKDDLYAYNGAGASTYLALARSTGTGLSVVSAYDNDPASATPSVPGWDLSRADQLFAADVNKDRKGDLFIYNPSVPAGELLGALTSSGTALSGASIRDWVLGTSGAGGWNLGAGDLILPANYEGGSGKAGLYIRNKDWFGLIRRTGTDFVMDRHYYQWIYSPLFDSKPWQAAMP